MRKKNRSFLLMSLISASLLVSVFTIVQAQSPAAPAAKATNWSDPATWPNRKVPVAGDKVIIEKDKQVVLDVTPPALNGPPSGSCCTGNWRSALKRLLTRARRPSPSPTTSKTKTSVESVERRTR